MSEPPLVLNRIYKWRVVGHARFGAWVEGVHDASGISGLIDIASMNLPQGEAVSGWLPVGSVVEGVVSFFRPEGGLQVSIRPEDLDAAKASSSGD